MCAAPFTSPRIIIYFITRRRDETNTEVGFNPFWHSFGAGRRAKSAHLNRTHTHTQPHRVLYCSIQHLSDPSLKRFLWIGKLRVHTTTLKCWLLHIANEIGWEMWTDEVDARMAQEGFFATFACVLAICILRNGVTALSSSSLFHHPLHCHCALFGRLFQRAIKKPGRQTLDGHYECMYTFIHNYNELCARREPYDHQYI